MPPHLAPPSHRAPEVELPKGISDKADLCPNLLVTVLGTVGVDEGPGAGSGAGQGEGPRASAPPLSEEQVEEARVFPGKAFGPGRGDPRRHAFERASSCAVHMALDQSLQLSSPTWWVACA